jgi:succinoglycan biosynthesis transport protein ExoP
MEEREEQADPHVFTRALRRRWAVIVLCALVVPATAVALSLRQEKQYTASASLLFRDPQFDQKLFGSTAFQPSIDPAREAATNVKLVSLETVAARTAKALGNQITASDVQNAITVESEGQSDVASIKATHHDPTFAAKLANTFAQQFIVFRREADRSKIGSAEQLVQAQLDRLPSSEQTTEQGRSLRVQAEQLRVLAALQTGNAELVQPAQPPSSPSAPTPVRNGVVGGLLGLLIGCGFAFLLERSDRRLRTAREIGDAFGRPILGTVPQSRSIAKAGGLRALNAGEAEAFRMLRANLRYFNVDSEIKSVLITSAAPAEGKSTVAMHLALTAAAGGSQVLLLEADLRKPTLAHRLGISPSEGLSQVLAGGRELKDAVKHVRLGTNGADARTVDVLPTGPIPPNPSDLVESDRMRQIVRAAEAAYDLVVIDTPPTSIVSDAIPLVNEVSGVIVVSRLGKTTRESAAHLRRQLEHLSAKTLGVVVNSVGRGGGPDYGYGYGGYGYGYTADETSSRRGLRRRKRATMTVAEAPAASSQTTDRFVEEAERPTRRSANGNGHHPGVEPPVAAVRPSRADGRRRSESFGSRMRRRLGG